MRLAPTLRKAIASSGKPVSQVCREAKVNESYLYKVVRGDADASVTWLDRVARVVGYRISLEPTLRGRRPH